jgi:carbonic anhydrase/acetyltransferase-like protein (isoleucine patch superfamily)
MAEPFGQVFAFEGHTPQIAADAYLAPGSHVIGRVTLDARVSVWFNAVLRGDLAAIRVGEGSNIQDNAMVHVEGAEERSDGREVGTVIGRNVTVGHNCVIHSCVLEDDVLVGMGAVILGGAVIGRGAVIGAGTVVLGNAVVPPYALVVGNPGQVRKIYDPALVEATNRVAAAVYQQRIGRYRQGLERVPWPRDPA